MNKKTAWVLLVSVFIVTILGAFFVFPNSPVSFLNNMPWRLGLDLVGGAQLTYRIDLSQIPAADQAGVIEGLRDVIERRVNLFGVSEPRVSTAEEGDDHYLIIELAGITDVAQAIKEIGDTPFLQFVEVQMGTTEGESSFAPTELDGRYVKTARIDFDQTVGKPQIGLEFNSEGATLFEQITARNIGKPLCIFIDNQPITGSIEDSCPTVNSAIAGGNAVVTGQFSIDEVRTWVQRFNAGALPAPIELVNQQTVGASLGRDSLQKSIIAGVVGTALVAVFMVAYYGFFGLLSVIALLIYIILSLGIFKIFVTMSLAGIAGFLLSIGMAVDANILIFERTKEEVRKGVSKSAAIAEGFRRAWTSIRDSNISTIITALILFNFTSSFVKGLALTLLLGVLVSMFTAITVTRGLMTVFVKKDKN